MIGPLLTNLTLIQNLHIFSQEEALKIPSANWRIFCWGSILNYELEKMGRKSMSPDHEAMINYIILYKLSGNDNND